MKRFALLLALVCAVPAIAEAPLVSPAVFTFYGQPHLYEAQTPDVAPAPAEVKVGVVDIKSSLLEAFVKYLVPVLFTGLSVLLALALASLRKKLEADAGNSKLAAVGARATAVIDSVTHDLEATLKPKLEEATKDGVLTPAEISQLRDVALARVKEILGKEGLDDVAEVLGVQGGAIDKVIQGLIEKSVAKLSSAAAPPPG